MVKIIGLSVFAAVLFALAVCCLFFPSKIQEIANKAVNWGMPSSVKVATSYMRLIIRFVQSRQYRLCVRLVGLLALFFLIFVIWMVVR